MRFALPLVLALLPAAHAQTVPLDTAFSQASAAQKAATLSGVRCWTRGKSAEADAAGMPARVCLTTLKPVGRKVAFTGTALLAGKAQTEPLSGEGWLSSSAIPGGTRAWTTVFRWEAGEGEFDEESIVQVEFRIDPTGAVVPGSQRLIAWHQCPERGCVYACGATAVEFVPEP